MSDSTHDAPHAASMSALTLGALGVVFGDIGTSPLYTLRECMHATGGAEATRADLFGVLSLIFWSLTLVVTVKYLFFIMRAHNRGEGGIFALLAIVPERLRAPVEGRVSGVALLVVVGAALLYGDGAITPAISVLSATEGLAMVRPGLASAAVPLTCLILVGLFSFQRYGTGVVGKLFGPVMLAWFGTIGGLGAWHIARNPAVLAALDPRWAARYFGTHGLHAGLVLGSVVLAVTGGEALYADMGHFGARPIRVAWTGFVLPCLVLNYFGQGALVLHDPAAIENPFFLLGPEWSRFPMVALATVATVIASQAVISGAYSMTRQCMQLGFLPRMTVRHTSNTEEGQIYVPQVNTALLVGVLILVLAFKTSDALAAAYGIAVTGTFICTAVLAMVVFRRQFHWSRLASVAVFGSFFVIDGVFFSANTLKVVEGGWVPLALGIFLTVLMTSWKRGRDLLLARWQQDSMPLAPFLARLPQSRTVRVPGLAVFLTGNPDYVPTSLLHNLKHNKVLHEHVLFVTVQNDDVPEIAPARRATVSQLAPGVNRVVLRYGFMESPNIPRELEELGSAIDFEAMQASYFLGRELLVPAMAPKMSWWRLWLFLVMARNAVPATEFFRIPSDRVVELGVRIAI